MKSTHDEKFIQELIEQSLKQIRMLSNAKDEKSITELTEHLIKLADLKQESGQVRQDIEKYTDAAIFYNHAISIINTHATPANKLDMKIKTATASLSQCTHETLQLLGIQNRKSVERIDEKIIKYKEYLKGLRVKVSNEISQINFGTIFGSLDVNNTKLLFTRISNGMKSFLSSLFHESEKEIGHSPCDYSVIGLGSLALNQATPYSDLEFGIIVERDSHDVQEYFKKLAHLINLKIINLGETSIPRHYKLNLDHFIHKGVMLDPGGKTPLGEKDSEGHEKYNLVKTVDGMLEYLMNEGDSVSKIDKNLHRILEKVCYVHGSKDLVSIYQDLTNEFLYSNKIHEGRAIETLQRGIFEVDGEIKTFNSGDISKFTQRDKSSSKAFDVKQDIYRLCDRLLYNLGLYFQADNDEKEYSVFNTIHNLKNKNFINDYAVANLKNATAFAMMLRLKVYCKNECHIDSIPLITLGESSKNVFHLPEISYKEGGDIFKFFHVVYPLQIAIERFSVLAINGYNADFFPQEKFYRDDNVSNGVINYRIGKYYEVSKCLHNYLDKEPEEYLEDQLALRMYRILGYSCMHIADYKNAVKCFEKSVHFLEVQLSQLNRQLQYNKETIEEFLLNEKASLVLAYKEDNQNDKCSNLAIDIYNHCSEAYVIALSVGYIDSNMNTRFGSMITSLQVVGNIYKDKEQYDKAMQVYEYMISIFEKIQDYRNLAVTYYDVARCYFDQKKYEKAEEYCNKSIQNFKIGINDGSIHGVIHAYNLLGRSLLEQNNLVDAMNHFNQARDICKKIGIENAQLISTDHTKITAYDHYNKGVELCRLGKLEDALVRYELAIKCHDFFEAHYNRALALCDLGRFREALASYDRAILLQPNFSDAYFNKGNALVQLNKLEEAIDSYNKALVLNPNNEGVINNIGTCNKAISALKNKAVKIVSQLSEEQFNSVFVRFLKYCDKMGVIDFIENTLNSESLVNITNGNFSALLKGLDSFFGVQEE